MSYAHFDEIYRICCEVCEDGEVIEMTCVWPAEGFPEGFPWGSRLRHELLLRDREGRAAGWIPPREEEAIYIIRYGHQV